MLPTVHDTLKIAISEGTTIRNMLLFSILDHTSAHSHKEVQIRQFFEFFNTVPICFNDLFVIEQNPFAFCTFANVRYVVPRVDRRPFVRNKSNELIFCGHIRKSRQCSRGGE